MYKNKSSRKIDSRRLFSRKYDFMKTFSLTENQFSGKTFMYNFSLVGVDGPDDAALGRVEHVRHAELLQVERVLRRSPANLRNPF